MDKVMSGAARAFAVIALLLLPACGTQYITPSGRADFNHLTNSSNTNEGRSRNLINNSP